MLTEVKSMEQTDVKWYEIPFPATAYTFPSEALIHEVELDGCAINDELTIQDYLVAR